MSGPVLALLPLDDRPPNLQFPRRLAAIAGLRLRLPPRRLLGRFLRPGDTDALWAWLEDAARGAAAVVVSCDMLAYGGLVGSRTTEVTRRAAIERVRRLRDLRRRFPHLRIHAFAVIPRLGLTVSSPELATLGPALARCQELRHRPALDAQEAQELAGLGATLPRALVERHAAMRRRNLAANKALVELVREGAVDFLVLAQEDAPTSGPHVAEQGELAAEAQRLGVASSVRIFPGADEQGMVLLARAAGEVLGVSAAVYPLYGTPGGADSVALFEDRPLRMTVAGQVEAAGLRVAPGEEGADVILALHSPPTPAQADINHISPASAPRPPFVAHAAGLARGGKPVALADVAYCNGADPALIAALGEHRVLPHLAAFAGWNTAGNTVGAALAHAALRIMGEHGRAGGRSLRAHLEFLFERLVDDYAYQSVVRADAYRFTREHLGTYPLHLRHGRRRALAYVRERLSNLAPELFARHFEGEAVAGRRVRELRDLRVRLPWPRLFEVEVEAGIALR